MRNSCKKLFAQRMDSGNRLLQKKLIASLFLVCSANFVDANPPGKILNQATQEIKGFARLAQLENGLCVVSSQPKNIRLFDPNTGKFIDTIYTLTNYSFPDDLVLIPEGYSIASFLDGRIPTVLNNGKVIQSNQGPFKVSPETGIFKASFNPQLQGANPITYRPSNGLLYTQGFDPNTLYSLKWQGSVPVAIPLTPATSLEGFAFGPDDKLYAPDIGNGQIVVVDADTGVVTPLPNTQGLIFPVDLKIANNGILYYLERPTGNVYQYNLATQTPVLLATLAPALEKVAVSFDQKYLLVSNDENRIVKVDIATGKTTILFDSQIIQPWGVAFDGDSDTLYIPDTGKLLQVNAKNGKTIRYVVIDTLTSGFLGAGQVNGIDIEQADQQNEDPKIVVADVTLGDILVFNKKDLTYYDLLSSSTTGLFEKQPFSAVRVTGGTPSEYYLIANAVDGTILKVYHPNPNDKTVTITELFFSGLNVPGKLKLYNGYVYIVEAGKLLEGIPNSGSISRISLANPTTKEILVPHLYNPQGLDIYNGIMVTAEVGKFRLLSASALKPSTPEVLATGLEFSNDLLISNLNPIPIDPMVGVAIDSKGKRIYVNQTAPNNIIMFKVNLN